MAAAIRVLDTGRKKAHKPFGMAAWMSNGGPEAYAKEQAALENYEYMRDNLMSLVKNSGMSFELIHERCGPHPATLMAWETKKILKPQFGKMYAVLQIIGKKFRDIEK
jgi:hypothetical protein